MASNATLDPVFIGSDLVLSNGNLTVANDGIAFNDGNAAFANSRGISSGKYYFECVCDERVTTSIGYVGIGLSAGLWGDFNVAPRGLNPLLFTAKGTKHKNNGNGTTYGTAWNNNDVIGVALDFTNDAVWFSINGTWQAGASLQEVQDGTTTNAAWVGELADRTWYPIVQMGADGTTAGQLTVRFDSGSFTQTQPSGFSEIPDAWNEAFDELDGRSRDRSVEEVRLSGPNRLDTIGETVADGGYYFSHVGKGSGKYYVELEVHDIGSGGRIGIVDGPENKTLFTRNSMHGPTTHYTFLQNGDKGNSGSTPTYGSAWADGNRIGMAVSFDTGAIWWSVDGVWQNGATLTEVQNETTTNAAYTFTVNQNWYIGVELFSASGNDTDLELITDPANFQGTQPTGYNAWKQPVTADEGPMAGMAMTVSGNANVQPVVVDEGPMAGMAMTVAGASNVQPVRADSNANNLILSVSANAKVPSTITDGPVGSMDLSVASAASVKPVHVDDGPMASIQMSVSSTGKRVGRLTDNMPGVILSVSANADSYPIHATGSPSLVLSMNGASTVVPKANTSQYFNMAMGVSGTGNVQPIHCT